MAHKLFNGFWIVLRQGIESQLPRVLQAQILIIILQIHIIEVQSDPFNLLVIAGFQQIFQVFTIDLLFGVSITNIDLDFPDIVVVGQDVSNTAALRIIIRKIDDYSGLVMIVSLCAAILVGARNGQQTE